MARRGSLAKIKEVLPLAKVEPLDCKLMIYLLLHYHILDYGRWKEGFDSHLSARQAGGATCETLTLRNVDDPHEIIVVLGWRDLAQARMFMQSVSWQMARQQMGVVGVLEVLFLEEAI